MVDSIGSAAMSLSQEQLMNQVQVSLLDKSLENAEAQGQEMVNLIEDAGEVASQQARRSQPAVNQQAPVTDPALGQNVDILA